MQVQNGGIAYYLPYCCEYKMRLIMAVVTFRYVLYSNKSYNRINLIISNFFSDLKNRVFVYYLVLFHRSILFSDILTVVPNVVRTTDTTESVS